MCKEGFFLNCDFPIGNIFKNVLYLLLHMRYMSLFILVLFIVSCKQPNTKRPFVGVKITPLIEDSMSVRAIEMMGNSLGFAGNKGIYGSIDLTSNKVLMGRQLHDDILPEFRAVAHTNNDFFMLSAGNPALLYKTGSSGKMELVYKEEGEGVFYDAMRFWNDKEGIAIGDAIGNCLSIIITRDGGNTWQKLSCEVLPEALKGEGAFAASNTNIAIIGTSTWIATSMGRVYYSNNKGVNWSIQKTPISHDTNTQGIFSITFYDNQLGVLIGGDFQEPSINKGNKAITYDGGVSWQLIAEGLEPGYKSCIEFVPNGDGKEMVSVGYTGISYSMNSGEHWESLSDEGFYTLKFFNDTVAYAAGKNRIAKLQFTK
jgi:photosystem II stability/assembly factor-like uncharacterized protein